MNSDITEKQTSAPEVEARPTSIGGPIYDIGEKVDYDRAGAIDAEEVEHRMTVLQAVMAYPAASWWAFVMSCTIVSSCPRQADHFSNVAIDHRVILYFLNRTIHSHSSIRQGFWCI
jgi:SP family general alpha glucoside:H+ symporter-like MFS transporter